MRNLNTLKNLKIKLQCPGLPPAIDDALAANHSPLVSSLKQHSSFNPSKIKITENLKALPSYALSARWCKQLKGIEMLAWGPNR